MFPKTTFASADNFALVYSTVYILLKMFVILQNFDNILLPKCNVKLESRYFLLVPYNR